MQGIDFLVVAEDGIFRRRCMKILRDGKNGSHAKYVTFIKNLADFDAGVGIFHRRCMKILRGGKNGLCAKYDKF